MTRAALLLVCFFATALAALAGDQKTLYVQVILGSDRDKPANSNWREVGPKLSAKLSPVFRWKHYWETDRKKVEFDPAKNAKVPLSNNRTLEIERLKTGELEVRLIRRTGLVTKARQARGGMAILGGEESSKDSFFVVVRSDEPTNRD